MSQDGTASTGTAGQVGLLEEINRDLEELNLQEVNRDKENQ